MDKKKRVKKSNRAAAAVSGGFSWSSLNPFKSDKPKIDKNTISGPTNAHGVGGMGNVPAEHVMEHGTPLENHWSFADMPKIK